jgi:hypothetical protein
VIENDIPKKPDGGLKKPSGSVKPVRRREAGQVPLG